MSSSTKSATSRLDKTILGVPARFMAPRLLLIAITIILVSFGLLMVYSSSSIAALTSATYDNDPTYFLLRQAVAVGVGTIVALALALIDYHLWCDKLIYLIWIVTIVLLGLVLTPAAGQDAYGATRWLQIASFTFQPSEIAKVSSILIAAAIAGRYYEDQVLDFNGLILYAGLGLGAILILILAQPDKGTAIIIGASLLCCMYLAGAPKRAIVPILVVGAVVIIFMAFRDEYSRDRITTMLDPWSDYYGAGYQLIQGFYAFGSGGLFGVGLGLSSQKYSYLPMAHNDFIFAVIGEELGLIGTLGVLAAFVLFVWAGYRIARFAPDIEGRLVAAGCTSLIWIQLLVNILGVLGVIPLTGKPVPFISYGGTTIISCLMMVGLIVSVSRTSRLPETAYDEKRERMLIASDSRDYGLSFAGDAHPRSDRSRASLGDVDAASQNFLSVVQGGRASAQTAAQSTSARKSSTRTSTTSSSSSPLSKRERINLGPSAAERLRSETKSLRESQDAETLKGKGGRRGR